MKILPFYASLLALLFVALSVRTLRLRRNLRIAIGDSGKENYRYRVFGMAMTFTTLVSGAVYLLLSLALGAIA